jgi:hypothetical protein
MVTGLSSELIWYSNVQLFLDVTEFKNAVFYGDWPEIEPQNMTISTLHHQIDHQSPMWIEPTTNMTKHYTHYYPAISLFTLHAPISTSV